MNLKLSILFCFLLLILVDAGRDFYNILGISRGSTKKAVKKAYRELARKLHPDKNKNDPKAEEKFRDINDAYEVLSNDEKRKIYDRSGEEGLKDMDRGGGPSMDPFSSFFGDFFDFGEGGNRGQQKEQRGETIKMDLWVSLEEMYNGNFIEVVRKKPVKKSMPGTRKCNCHYEMRTTAIGPGRFTMNQVEVCNDCPNYRFELEERLLEVEVESGMKDGFVYPFKGEGEPHEDGEPGDLEFIIRQTPHDVFHRKGNDLYTNMTLSLVDALNGFDLELKHLDGHKVKVSRTKVTWPGAVLRIRGEGMPNQQRPDEKGVLFITFDVAFPRSKELSSEDKESISKVFGKSDTSNGKEVSVDSSSATSSKIKHGNGPAVSHNGIEFPGPKKHLSNFV